MLGDVAGTLFKENSSEKYNLINSYPKHGKTGKNNPQYFVPDRQLR